MAGKALWTNASGGAPSYTANELRAAMSLLLTAQGAGVFSSRQGVRPGIPAQLDVTLSGSTITVAPGVACVSPGLTTIQGPYWVALMSAETHALAVADATLPRRDLVILRVYDHDEDSSGLRLVRTEYLVGAASASPVDPAVPAGAVTLARIQVPQVGGGSAVVTDLRPYTVAAGAILPVRFDSDLSSGLAGRYRDRLDLTTLERDSGAGWQTVADPAVFTPWTASTPSWTSTGTSPTVGNATREGRYKQVGKMVTYSGRIVIGSTTVLGTGNWRVALPVPARNANFDAGSGAVLDVNAAANHRPVTCFLADTFTLRFLTPTGELGPSTPFAFEVNDQIRWSITYEAA